MSTIDINNSENEETTLLIDTTEPLFFVYDEEEQGLRLDVYLSQILEEVSRSYIQKLIKDGRVTVNEQTKNVKKHPLKKGDRVTIDIPKAEILQVEAENIDIEVIYEDDELIVVNKPQGMVVHPAPGNYTGTLVNALMYHCEGRLSSINGVIRPGIVHRIDKDTSGLLMVAKTDMAHRKLAEELKAYKSVREYLTLVVGHVKHDKGTINAPVGRSTSNRLKMAVTKDGREAITHYEVVKHYQGYTLVKCRLETGRTHQIRVHMQHLGYPIVGDPLYGHSGCKFKQSGQLLHARTLGFTHPKTGEFMTFEAPIPAYFERLIKLMKEE